MGRQSIPKFYKCDREIHRVRVRRRMHIYKQQLSINWCMRTSNLLDYKSTWQLCCHVKFLCSLFVLHADPWPFWKQLQNVICWLALLVGAANDPIFWYSNTWIGLSCLIIIMIMRMQGYHSGYCECSVLWYWTEFSVYMYVHWLVTANMQYIKLPFINGSARDSETDPYPSRLEVPYLISS